MLESGVTFSMNQTLSDNKVLNLQWRKSLRKRCQYTAIWVSFYSKVWVWGKLSNFPLRFWGRIRMSILHNLLAKLYIPSTLNSYGRGLEKFPLELGAPACICAVLPKLKNTVACGLKFHFYLRVLCWNFPFSALFSLGSYNLNRTEMVNFDFACSY